MRYLILFVLVIVLASCTPQAESTPTAPPAPMPTPTAKPRIIERSDLEKARGAIVRLQGATRLTYRDIPRLKTSVGGDFVDMLCRVADGEFAPDVELTDLTEEGRMLFAIRDYCKHKHDYGYPIRRPDPLKTKGGLEY